MSGRKGKTPRIGYSRYKEASSANFRAVEEMYGKNDYLRAIRLMGGGYSQCQAF